MANAEKQERMGFVGKRLSAKQAKLYLLSTPKHGPQRRSTMKFWMGLRERARGEPRQPPRSKETN